MFMETFNAHLSALCGCVGLESWYKFLIFSAPSFPKGHLFRELFRFLEGYSGTWDMALIIAETQKPLAKKFSMAHMTEH